MKTVIYARKSSESEERQIQSIDDQLRTLREHARREGIRIDEVYVESRSAKAPYTRPEFQRMCEAIQNGEVRRILTWSMNRLSRNLVDGGLVAHMLQTGMLDWIRTIDRTYLPEDNVLLLSIENGMATGFIQDLRKSVVRGMEGKATRGWLPGRVPIGYVNNPVTREIDIDLKRFALIRKGWDMVLSGGFTPTEVFRTLMSLELTSRVKGNGDRPLSRSVIFSMFSNPFYKGEIYFGGKRYPGKHQPLVTPEEYDKVQLILGRALPRRLRKHSFLFGGIFKCGKCGCQIVGETKVKTFRTTGRSVRYTYYHCTNGKGGCFKQSIREDRLAAEIKRAFNRVAVPKSFAAWAKIETVRQAEKETVVVASSTSNIKAKLARENQRLLRLREMRIDSELSADEYAIEKSRTSNEIERLEGALQTSETEEERILRLINEKLDLAVEANEFEAKEDGRARGMIKSLGSQHFLTLSKLQLRVHPILKKITTFEPARNGFQSPKPDDLVPSNSVWYALIAAIRKIARTEIRRQDAEKLDGDSSSERMAA